MLSRACTHHGLLLSIHFHKGVTNSASVILIGLILFLFLFPPLCRFAAGVLAAVTASERRRCYHMLSSLVLPHACLLLQDSKRERERLWGDDGLGIKKKKVKKKKKKHLHSWKSREESVLRQNAGSWRWNPLRDSKSESEWSADLRRTIVRNSFIQVYSVWLHATVTEACICKSWILISMPLHYNKVH